MNARRGWWLFLDDTQREEEIYFDGNAWFYWGRVNRYPPPYKLIGPCPDTDHIVDANNMVFHGDKT